MRNPSQVGRSTISAPGRVPQNTLPLAPQPGFRGNTNPSQIIPIRVPARSPVVNNSRGPGMATSPMNNAPRASPVPMVEMTRIKCYYKDKRLVEIPKENCAFFDFKQRVEAKCATQGLLIKYQSSSGEMSNIGNQAELDYALNDSGDLTIYVNKPGEINTFEPKVEPPAAEDDWQECFTDDGEMYYFNMTTQESSWDPPVVKPKVVPVVKPQVKAASNVVSKANNNTNNGYGGFNVPMKQAAPVAQVKQNRSDWMECYDDDGEKYYFNMVTEESSWDPPT